MATRTRQPLNPSTTYTLAHTAQCKLKLAANRPDRNLRFVLGHAFTLDNLMLRIVEIENQNAKSVFQEGVKSPSDHADEHYDCTAANPVDVEPDPHYDCTKPAPEPEEHYDCTKVESEPASQGRRISFQDNNARPSRTGGLSSYDNNGGAPGPPARKNSPPPVANTPHKYFDDDDDDDTSSDDYDEPSTYLYDYEAATPEKKAPKPRPKHDAYSDEEDAALELADDELDDDAGDLGLTRFESASAQPPRMVRSTSPSSSEDETEPLSPPQLPADVDVRELITGEKDGELADLYESVRRCGCHGQRDLEEVGGKPDGVWDVPVEKTGGRRYAVVAVAA